MGPTTVGSIWLEGAVGGGGWGQSSVTFMSSGSDFIGDFMIPSVVSAEADGVVVVEEEEEAE